MKIKITSILLVATVAVSWSFAQSPQKIDYRYAPAWHASTISLPDDTCKTVVGHLGQMLYDYGGNRFFPYSNDKGFRTIVHFLPDEGLKFGDQKLYSPRVPIVQTDATYNGMPITQEAFALGMDYIRKGVSTKQGNREDVVLTTVKNTTSKAQTLNPMMVIDSEHIVKVENGYVIITDTIKGKNRVSHIYTSQKIKRVRQNLADFKTVIDFEPVQLAAGESRKMIVLYDNARQSAIVDQVAHNPQSLVGQIDGLRKEVINYWENATDIPYGHVNVPDVEIQNIIDASIRGVWQAREIKDNKISFQVGPTCYRGLWITDGAFFLEMATMLDRGTDARDGIDYTMTFQQENGRFGKMSADYHKENGIVLWTCVRHALLTQDKAWLKSVWPQLKKTVDFIKELRQSTYTNQYTLDDGLMPPGIIDGGLWGSNKEPEYTNVYWNMTGLKAMIQAAHWIGEKKDAKDWEKEYADFEAKFQTAIHRDVADDGYGNKYIPVLMDTKDRALPQRAQWAFCQGIYPGQIFDMQDPLAKGTMDMLQNSLQQGIVLGTGWMPDGIWTYFASFYGHACLWMGEGNRAAESLYAFGNHASPVYTWREEQTPRDMEAKYWGEMPHNWGSAEFVRLAVHMLALDRGNELHLLEGMPKEWLGAGMTTSLKDIATPFGKVTFTLQVDASGKEASLNIEKLSDKSCTAIYVHTANWGDSNGSNLVKLDPSKANSLTIKLK